MEDKKQIEEMKNCVTCMHYYYCYKNQKAQDNGEVAKANLFKQVDEQGCIYYTHEDSIVLSKEKYKMILETQKHLEKKYSGMRDEVNLYKSENEIIKQNYIQLKQDNEQARKEGVREALQRLGAIYEYYSDEQKTSVYFLRENLKELAKELSVEVE